MKRIPIKYVGLALLAAFAGMQLWPVDRSNPAVTDEIEAPSEIMGILRHACYDCHSHETRWPWYAWVAPVSWLVTHDVDEGRAVINFSTWAQTDAMTRAYNRGEIFRRVSRGEMPPALYLTMHPDARLSDEEIALLEKWSDGR